MTMFLPLASFRHLPTYPRKPVSAAFTKKAMNARCDTDDSVQEHEDAPCSLIVLNLACGMQSSDGFLAGMQGFVVASHQTRTFRSRSSSSEPEPRRRAASHRTRSHGYSRATMSPSGRGDSSAGMTSSCPSRKAASSCGAAFPLTS